MIGKVKKLTLIVEVINKDSSFYRKLGWMIDCESHEYFTIEFSNGDIEDFERKELSLLGVINNETNKVVY